MIREEILANNKTRDGKWLEHILLDQVTGEDTLELYHSAMGVNFIITMVPVPLNVVAALSNAPGTSFPLRPILGVLQISIRAKVMVAPTIPVSADFVQGSFRDMIDIGVNIIHLELVATVAFPAATVVRTLAQHREAIRGIQEHLLGVPIHEELTALRFRVDIAEAENASLCARIKTMEAVEKTTRNHERHARIEIERQLAAVQESRRQDREDFRKLKELVTSQFRQRS
ncbi:hypothetical protein Tco_0891716 [Tanacetum coccineum]|uniref:Uncharacterized protein n=1 Tax=Tanacetum coccineum TaxID=301880 RepID=A0ABQ5C960_9ASTR